MLYVLDSSADTKSTIAELYHKYKRLFEIKKLQSDFEPNTEKRLMLLNDSYTCQYIANTLKRLWQTPIPNLKLEARNEFAQVATELNDPDLIALAEQFTPYVAPKKERYKAYSQDPVVSLYKLSLINRENAWRQSLSEMDHTVPSSSEVPASPSSPVPFR